MKKRILVIDDEEILTRTFVKLLEKVGHEAMVTSNGDDAMIMIEEEEFDLIISDIRIPGRNGVEIVSAIYKYLEREEKNRPKCIFVTGFADEVAREAAMKLNPVGFIHKPFDMQELLGKITEALT